MTDSDEEKEANVDNGTAAAALSATPSTHAIIVGTLQGKPEEKREVKKTEPI